MTEENYKLATEIKEQIDECEMWISILTGGYAVEAYTQKYLRQISKKKYEVIGIWTSRCPLQGFKMPRFMEKNYSKL